MQQIARAIDALNENLGTYSAYLILPLVGVVVYEVVMRYAFDSPTSWGFETTTFLFGVHFMMALSYAQKHDSHVAIDVFEMRLAPRARTILRIITAILIFVPTIGLLTAWSIKYAVTSWQQWELASSSWAPPVYPFKTIMAIGFVLWFLQGIARLLQDIRSLGRSDNA